MALRKASAYSKKRVLPFTRISKKKGKAYIKTLPEQKIVKFSMGSEKLYNKGKLPYNLTLISEENVQIRHNALEACRQYINKKLEEELSGQYLFRVIPFPHHIQRENRMYSGGSKGERINTGMQLSYGKTAVKAAIVKPGSKIFFVAVHDEKTAQFVRDTLKKIKSKLPCKTKVIYEAAK